MADKLDFGGEGFSKDDFSPEERAQMRERSYHYDQHYLGAEQFLEKTGLKWISQIGKSAPAFLKAAGFVTAIGAAYIMAQNLGWL